MSDSQQPPESVYNHLSKEESKVQKAPRYVSKFRQAVILENKATKDSMKTMGPANVEMPSPDKFLKKHSKEPKLPEVTECSKKCLRTCTCTVRKPPVPKRTDIPPMEIHTKKDFSQTTVAVPVKPTPASVDSRKGDKQLLEQSGLVPKYVLKQDYGEVPAYLQKRREEETKTQEEYERFIAEQKEQEAKKRLSEEERQSILKGLKKRWDHFHREYQCLPLIIDTFSKKAHKKRLEEAMSQLEKDISYFETYTIIYKPKD
ncbi:enkurin [Nothobranchius furzeri]|uniref:TRPC channel interacting protein n=3 Tax=Nothobranchius TaxID=28779 RepID=A0A1A8A3A2_NOTFU|nr:enkurin [Nothobranchius furzeri]KAF7214120.1 TRPC channel interacting protein [Nothobranchius furzeri]